jgi:hypothetical protein
VADKNKGIRSERTKSEVFQEVRSKQNVKGRKQKYSDPGPDDTIHSLIPI